MNDNKLVVWQGKLKEEEKRPAHVLNEFFKAWAEKDTETMIRSIQLSITDLYMRETEDFSEHIKAKFIGSKKLLGVTIVEHEVLNPVVFRARAFIKAEIARGVSKVYERDVRLICESEPMTPSPNGTWGVNTTSVEL